MNSSAFAPLDRESHVVHLVPALFGPTGVVGGAERYALELARHMASRVPTTLLTFGDESREERQGALRIKVLRRQCLIRGQPQNSFSLRLVPELLRADVIHCHQQHIFASSVSALVARMFRRRIFVSDLGGGGWDISAYVSTDRLYQGHLHISEYSREIYGHAGKPWAHVIYGGVDVDKFHPAKPGTCGDAVRSILYVGRLLPHKGVNYLVEAATPEMRLTLVGRPYDAAYLGELRRLATGKDVVFQHDFTDEALIATYQRALCVVLPSVYRSLYGAESAVPELLGQTLLEGMACGIPAICSNVASMPEIVEDGVTGFIVPPNDASALRNKLLWLLEHPDEASRMGALGRRRVLANFRWDSVVDHCFALYGASLRQAPNSAVSDDRLVASAR